MFVIKVWDAGKWHYLAHIHQSAVVLTDDKVRAERYKTELDARVAGCYLPEETRWEITPA